MIPAHAQEPDGVDGHGFGAVGGGDHHRLPTHAVGRQDRHLRLVDDRQNQEAAERARVRERERTARDVVDRELFVARPAGEIVDLAGDGPQAKVVRFVHHRREETFEVEVDRDRQVDVVVHDQLAVGDGGVDVRELTERVDHGPSDERQVREAEAFRLTPFVAMGAPHAIDTLVVDLDDRVGVRRRCLRHHHVLGRAAPDVVQGLDGVARAGSGSRHHGPAAARRGQWRGRVLRARRARPVHRIGRRSAGWPFRRRPG